MKKLKVRYFIMLLLSSAFIAQMMQPCSRLISCAGKGCKAAPLLIGTPLAVYCSLYGIMRLKARKNPPEIILRKFSSLDAHSLDDHQTLTLFAHGIAETHEQARWYTRQARPDAHLINGDMYTYDYPDVTRRFWRVNFTKTALGQTYEVQGLESAYNLLIEQQPDKHIILMGLSRGAATILNFVGLHKPQQVKALIVESPFDSTETIVHDMLRKCSLDWVPGMPTIGNYLMSAVFWQHSPSGMQPIHSIKNIDKKLPILLVCSKNDQLVPPHSTINLYRTLKELGHEQVHIFVAESGKHGRILHGADGHNYEKAVHAFYKKCGLPHEDALAGEGEPLLDVIPSDLMG